MIVKVQLAQLGPNAFLPNLKTTTRARGFNDKMCFQLRNAEAKYERYEIKTNLMKVTDSDFVLEKQYAHFQVIVLFLTTKELIGLSLVHMSK